VVLYQRTQQAAASARTAANHQLAAVEKSLATLVAKAGRAESERKVILRRTNALRSSILTDQQAVQQLIARFQPEAPLPVVGGWALDPTALFWLVDHVDRARPQLVVECGSGTSTLWIAFALRRNGSGRVVSFEHSEEFAASTRQLLERHGLSDWAQVRTAPLVPVETAGGTFPWYDVDPATLGPIDLLFIDGPPEATGRHARYPALPVLGGRLAPGAVVVLDDAGRDDEREVLQRWLAEDERLRPYANPGPDTRALILG
jgi:predicted O-methyltransferase YrrM